MSLEKIMKEIERDPKLKKAMENLQLTEKTLNLLPLFPLIYVAWADGKLEEAEIEKILQIAEESGLVAEEGAGLLRVWLDPKNRPSKEFFTDGLRLTAAVFKYTRPSYKNNLVQLCEEVAEAGGFLGKVKRSEKQALMQIAELLDVKGEESYYTLIERMRQELTPEELKWIPAKMQPKWVVINTISALAVGAIIFLVMFALYDKLVVTELHEWLFMLALLIVPQVGFFLSGVITGRLSESDTRKENALGTLIAILLFLIAGGVWSGQLSKKYVGFAVFTPDTSPILYPQCEGLKYKNQRCVVEDMYKGKKICRILPRADVDPKKQPIKERKKFQDWFPIERCTAEKAADVGLFDTNVKDPKLYKIDVGERLLSKGYYPLCVDLHEEDKQSCIYIYPAPNKPEEKVCRIVANPTERPKELGKKFRDWFPTPRYCAPVYTQVYQLWKKREGALVFEAYLPLCEDIQAVNQECLYIKRIKRPDTGKKEKVCIVSSNRTISPDMITLEKEPYINWFPRSECRPIESTGSLGYLIAAIGFAFLAFLSSMFGAWVGERWRGNV